MNKSERILSAISMACSVIPFILVLMFVRIIPVDIVIFEDESVNDPLFAGLLCIIPMTINMALRLMRDRGIMKKSAWKGFFITVVIAVMFTVIVFYSVIYEYANIKEMFAEGVEFGSLDYYGIIAVALCMLFAVAGSMISVTPSEKGFCISNRFTMQSEKVFVTVNRVSSKILTFSFLLFAVVLSFLGGWELLLVPLVGMGIFIIWSYVFSYFLFKKAIEKNKNSLSASITGDEK